MKFQMQLTATTESKDIIQKFMQYIQDFNQAHNDVIHFDMFTNSDPQMSKEECEELLDSLIPKLPFKQFLPKGNA